MVGVLRYCKRSLGKEIASSGVALLAMTRAVLANRRLNAMTRAVLANRRLNAMTRAVLANHRLNAMTRVCDNIS